MMNFKTTIKNNSLQWDRPAEQFDQPSEEAETHAAGDSGLSAKESGSTSEVRDDNAVFEELVDARSHTSFGSALFLAKQMKHFIQKQFGMEEKEPRQLELMRINERIRKLETDLYDLEQQRGLGRTGRHQEDEETRKGTRLQVLRLFKKLKREVAELLEIKATQPINELNKEQEEIPKAGFENKLQLEEARELAKMQTLRVQEERIRRQILLEQARQDAEEAEREKKEMELKMEAINEFRQQEEETGSIEEQEKAADKSKVDIKVVNRWMKVSCPSFLCLVFFPFLILAPF